MYTHLIMFKQLSFECSYRYCNTVEKIKTGSINRIDTLNDICNIEIIFHLHTE